jgi:hypothetical protein
MRIVRAGISLLGKRRDWVVLRGPPGEGTFVMLPLAAQRVHVMTDFWRFLDADFSCNLWNQPSGRTIWKTSA